MKRLLAPIVLLASMSAFAITPAEFENPPLKYGPHVWWHWMDGNVTREGITADLEAMKAAGIAGAQSFDCNSSTPLKPGPVDFRSDEWYEMVRHAHSEAKRLGLELCLANCSGYSSSGGPWVSAEDSMKTVVVFERELKAGDAVALPEAVNTNCFYRDIAILAFPVPAALAFAGEGGPGETVDFGEAREIREIRYSFAARGTVWDVNAGTVDITVEGSDDRENWRTISAFSDNVTPNFHVVRSPRYHRFAAPATVRYVRTRFAYRAGYVRGEAPAGAVAYGNFGKVADYLQRTFAQPNETYASGAQPKLAEPADGAGVCIDVASIVDLTSKVRADGTLDWSVSDDRRWTLMRVGYKSTGAVSSPATAAGRGLEVDKLDRAAVGRFFDGYLRKVIEVCGIDPAVDPHGRAGFNATLIDSWEVGAQNWTHGFERKFAAAKGYDPVAFLPVFAGYFVGSAAETERFTRDFVSLVAEEFGANYTDELAKLCHERGILLQVEPYTGMPSTSERYMRAVDLPTCEFWWKPRAALEMDPSCTLVSRLAHAAKRPIVSAESFTSFPEDDDWRHSPRDYKAIGDFAYCHGVNRIVYHRFAHQPKLDEFPGMTMGYWGTHFERTQTWWPFVGDWVKYQTRCQYLLQEGEFADGIAEPGAEPSFAAVGAEAPRFAWIHRRYADGAEAWFVATTNDCRGAFDLRFADSGRFTPEVWDPETGARRRAQVVERTNGWTTVRLELGWCGSAFVVFRPDADAPVAPVAETVGELSLNDGWTIEFPAGWGAPNSFRMKRLADLSQLDYQPVKFFSGTCVYARTVQLDAASRRADRFELELGEVGVVARVSVNGVAVPAVAWHPPYRVDITEGVKCADDGRLVIEVEVANTWVNRLVGDEVMFPKGDPRRFTRTQYRPWKWRNANDLPPSGILGPVKLSAVRFVK